MASNELQLQGTSCHLINPAVDRTSSSCLFVSKHKSNKCFKSKSAYTGSRITALGMWYILVTLPLSSPQQFHFHPEESLANHAFSDNEYKQSLASGYTFFEILMPEELQYTYKISPAPFALPFNATFRDPIALVMSDPPCGCSYLRNFEDVEGNIVLMERGECSFVSKAVRAQEAGAVAAIITDQDAENDELYISMVDDITGRKVTIPTGFLLGKNGHYIRRTLERHKLDRAMIRIPVNISSAAITEINQPPWLIW